MTPKIIWYAMAVFWGCIALGDDHGGGGGSPGGWPDCSACANINCYAECADLIACYLEGGDMVECSAEMAAFQQCCGSPPPVFPPPVFPPQPPPCPEGQQFGSDGECSAPACPAGTERDSAGACVPDGRYKVARCTRNMLYGPTARLTIGHITYDWKDLLPEHHNALAEDTSSNARLELGFFASGTIGPLLAAVVYATSYGYIIFSDATVYDDGNLGDCVEESVSEARYKQVRDQMNAQKTSWEDRFHLLAKRTGPDGYGTCVTWVTSVLAQ